MPINANKLNKTIISRNETFTNICNKLTKFINYLRDMNKKGWLTFFGIKKTKKCKASKKNRIKYTENKQCKQDEK